LLVKAVEEHRDGLGQVPDLVAADAAFHSPTQKTAIQKMGVKHISVPNRPTKILLFASFKDSLVSKRSEVANRQ